MAAHANLGMNSEEADPVDERGPARYAWVEDGELTAGTLDKFARSWEHAHYSGYPDLRGDTLLTWDGVGEPVQHKVRVTQRGVDEQDYIGYEISVNGETAFVSIDGRA